MLRGENNPVNVYLLYSEYVDSLIRIVYVGIELPVQQNKVTICSSGYNYCINYHRPVLMTKAKCMLNHCFLFVCRIEVLDLF